ncbi:flagellar export chaperone FliS [Kiloniella sp. b19]|uniref:flagellar export chaperone FliS n=1 Tax=Kiloniella sp. GXU_MW_B19 TaxID=3141326 RepID=UPI0031E3D093
MYPNPYGANAYKQASQNVSALKAVVMLYDGMIRLVGEAKRADAEGRFEDRFKLTEKASRVLIGLQGQLDYDNGGELSPRLNSFYDMLFMRMMQINSRNAQVVADDVLASLKEMRSAWEQVRQEVDSQPAATK